MRLKKQTPDVLDRATDMIERWTKEGLDADDFIKKVVDMHGKVADAIKALKQVLDVIDKYKAESEDKDED